MIQVCQPRFLRRGRPSLLVLLLPLLFASPAPAQEARTAGRDDVFVGGELEAYLRVLQASGSVGLHPWSVRGFGGRELDGLMPAGRAHPWAARYALTADSLDGVRLAPVAQRVQLIYNSAFPFGPNDGVVWAGRGLTSVFQTGLSLRWGPASLVLAPVLFRAENREFPLTDNGRAGPTRFGDYRDPYYIDLPQRFGEEPYTRLDPGQSTLRLDLGPVALGASTANQAWGPARDHPILLGHNAPGFLHAFAGTARPLNVGIGRVHGRAVWGRLEQSAYSGVQDSATVRLMTGVVGVFQPRGVPGLELGAGRFFHTGIPDEGLSAADYLKPFESFLKAYLRSREIPGQDIPDILKSDDDNQLASVFARWVLPRGGFEIYGEYGREDHNYNLRDVAVQLDQHSAYMLGFQKVWTRSPERLLVLRGEVLNAQPTHLLRVRGQYPFYLHGAARQGHTHRGQLLGSPAAYGGAGSVLAGEYYHPRGRWTLEWSRWVRRERWSNLELLGDVWGETWTRDTDGVDVIQALGAQALVFLGPLDLTFGLTGAHNLNRDFERDLTNWRASFGIRAGW